MAGRFRFEAGKGLPQYQVEAASINSVIIVCEEGVLPCDQNTQEATKRPDQRGHSLLFTQPYAQRGREYLQDSTSGEGLEHSGNLKKKNHRPGYAKTSAESIPGVKDDSQRPSSQKLKLQ